jgi:hypothetical protein
VSPRKHQSLSGGLLAKKPLDEPFSDEELAELSFQGFRDRVIRHSGKKNPTVRDFINVSGRGTVKEHTMFCGSLQQVADQMEEWFTAPACDGFVLAASSIPGAYDDVVRLLVPELQRRGLFHKEYAGLTLRDNLGLAIPRAADWHAARRQPVGRDVRCSHGARQRSEGRRPPSQRLIKAHQLGTYSPSSGAYCCPP